MGNAINQEIQKHVAEQKEKQEREAELTPRQRDETPDAPPGR